MRNSLKRLVVFSFLLLPGAVPAETTANDLTQIEAETTVLKARAKKIEIQAQIASKQAEIDRLAGAATVGEPTVRAIEGIGKTLYSTLQLENGSTIEVRAGDILPNGLKILSITHNAVIVQGKGRKRFRLASGAPVLRPAHSAPLQPMRAGVPTLPWSEPARGALQ
jgi:type IV pilus biogenesis protein PilP